MRRLLSAVLLTAVLGEAQAAPSPQEAETTLLDFVEGRGSFQRQRVQLAHSGTYSRMTLNRACFFFRQQATPKALDALTAVLTRRAEAPSESQARAAFVLARLGVVAAVPTLIALARAEEALAIEGLEMFGDGPVNEGFYLPGGSFPTAIFAPTPDSRATEALLALFASTPVLDGGDRWSEQQRRDEALRALAPHKGPAVDAAFAAALDEPALQATALGAALSNGRELPFEKLVALLDSTTDDVARLAAWVLGQSARREAIPPLIAHLSSPREDVRFASRRALANLAGLDQTPPQAVKLAFKPAEVAWWRARFGLSLEHFDPSIARRPLQRPPGIYDF